MEFIKCHGSGNDFILIDAVKYRDFSREEWSDFARVACCRVSGIGSDGVLLLVKHADGVYGMDMLNPDGTYAEMCGNGIRCVARLAYERGYITQRDILRSGGRDYKVQHIEPIDGEETFGVDIPINTWSKDFTFYSAKERFVARKIEALDDKLEFTALNLGNPHIVAEVESISLEHLTTLGERVIKLKELFPFGVNVSFYERRSPREIFVSTYERGAGLTLSCGTAMTASATAVAIRGRVDAGECIEVRNRGGRVFCTTQLSDNIITRLEGNATFEWYGEASFVDGKLSFERK
ncbi:MAG: diaminopimelate epimerase [Alistipes sp.]|nr:diaminopimelate epimerase [Alistipes sp.]